MLQCGDIKRMLMCGGNEHIFEKTGERISLPMLNRLNELLEGVTNLSLDEPPYVPDEVVLDGFCGYFSVAGVSIVNKWAKLWLQYCFGEKGVRNFCLLLLRLVKSVSFSHCMEMHKIFIESAPPVFLHLKFTGRSDLADIIAQSLYFALIKDASFNDNCNSTETTTAWNNVLEEQRQSRKSPVVHFSIFLMHCAMRTDYTNSLKEFLELSCDFDDIEVNVDDPAICSRRHLCTFLTQNMAALFSRCSTTLEAFNVVDFLIVCHDHQKKLSSLTKTMLALPEIIRSDCLDIYYCCIIKYFSKKFFEFNSDCSKFPYDFASSVMNSLSDIARFFESNLLSGIFCDNGDDRQRRIFEKMLQDIFDFSISKGLRICEFYEVFTADLDVLDILISDIMKSPNILSTNLRLSLLVVKLELILLSQKQLKLCSLQLLSQFIRSDENLRVIMNKLEVNLFIALLHTFVHMCSGLSELESMLGLIVNFFGYEKSTKITMKKLERVANEFMSGSRRETYIAIRVFIACLSCLNHKPLLLEFVENKAKPCVLGVIDSLRKTKSNRNNFSDLYWNVLFVECINQLMQIFKQNGQSFLTSVDSEQILDVCSNICKNPCEYGFDKSSRKERCNRILSICVDFLIYRSNHLSGLINWKSLTTMSVYNQNCIEKILAKSTLIELESLAGSEMSDIDESRIVEVCISMFHIKNAVKSKVPVTLFETMMNKVFNISKSQPFQSLKLLNFYVQTLSSTNEQRSLLSLMFCLLSTSIPFLIDRSLSLVDKVYELFLIEITLLNCLRYGSKNVIKDQCSLFIQYLFCTINAVQRFAEQSNHLSLTSLRLKHGVYKIVKQLSSFKQEFSRIVPFVLSQLTSISNHSEMMLYILLSMCDQYGIAFLISNLPSSRKRQFHSLYAGFLRVNSFVT